MEHELNHATACSKPVSNLERELSRLEEALHFYTENVSRLTQINDKLTGERPTVKEIAKSDTLEVNSLIGKLNTLTERLQELNPAFSIQLDRLSETI